MFSGKTTSLFVNDISPSNISTFVFKCFGHFSVVHDYWKQVWPNKIFNCLPWSSRNLVLLQKRPALFSECEGSCMACLVRMFCSKMKMLCLPMQMYFWTSLLTTQKVTFQVKRSNNRKYVCIHRLEDVMHYCKSNWRTTYDFIKTLFAVYYAIKKNQRNIAAIKLLTTISRIKCGMQNSIQSYCVNLTNASQSPIFLIFLSMFSPGGI